MVLNFLARHIIHFKVNPILKDLMDYIYGSTSYLGLKKNLAKLWSRGFPGGAVVGNPPANAGDTGSSPGLGRSHMPRSN